MLANEVRFSIVSFLCKDLHTFAQGARLREKQQRKDVSDELSESSEDESDIEEELGYISPLDTVDAYGTFKQALTSMLISPISAGPYVEPTRSFPDERREQLPARDDLADPRAADASDGCYAYRRGTLAIQLGIDPLCRSYDPLLLSYRLCLVFTSFRPRRLRALSVFSAPFTLCVVPSPAFLMNPPSPPTKSTSQYIKCV